MRENATYYLENGTCLVWLVHPNQQAVEACTLHHHGKTHIETFAPNRTVDGGTVVQVFTVLVKDVFPKNE